MLVLVGSDREQGERGSGLGASDRRTRSMVYSVTDKGRRRKRRCAKSQRTSLFLSFLDPSKPKPTKTINQNTLTTIRNKNLILISSGLPSHKYHKIKKICLQYEYIIKRKQVLILTRTSLIKNQLS